MARIQPMAEAEGKSAELLEIVQKKLGKKPNMMRTMAHSPAVLEAYLNFSGALNGASIPLKTREMIALLCARKNSCDYCLAAHTAIGAKVGLSEVEIEESLIGRSADQKTAAILKLVNTILDTNGSISDADFAAAKSAGLSDAELVEIPAIVGLNVFTNYFNHIIDPEIDFPKPKQSSCGCSSC